MGFVAGRERTRREERKPPVLGSSLGLVSERRARREVGRARACQSWVGAPAQVRGVVAGKESVPVSARIPSAKRVASVSLRREAAAEAVDGESVT